MIRIHLDSNHDQPGSKGLIEVRCGSVFFLSFTTSINMSKNRVEGEGFFLGVFRRSAQNVQGNVGIEEFWTDRAEIYMLCWYKSWRISTQVSCRYIQGLSMKGLWGPKIGNSEPYRKLSFLVELSALDFSCFLLFFLLEKLTVSLGYHHSSDTRVDF